MEIKSIYESHLPNMDYSIILKGKEPILMNYFDFKADCLGELPCIVGRENKFVLLCWKARWTISILPREMVSQIIYFLI